MIHGNVRSGLSAEEEAEPSEDFRLAPEALVRAAHRQKDAGPTTEWKSAQQRNAVGLRRVAHVGRAPLHGQIRACSEKCHEYAGIVKRTIGLPPHRQVRVVVRERANDCAYAETTGQVLIAELSCFAGAPPIVAERRGKVDVTESR